MGRLASHGSRCVAALALTVLIAVPGWILLVPEGPLGDGLVRLSYDSLHRIGPQPETKSGVIIVYLDLPSYLDLHQNPADPWSRELHAKLVKRLTAAGARAVIFDIVFDGPSDPSADQALAAALRENGRVVLAAEYNEKRSHITSESEVGGRVHKLQPPYALLADAAAGWGIAEQRMEDDYVVRRYLAGTGSGVPSLTWAAAQMLKLPISAGDKAMESAQQHRVRYYGPALAIPHVSYFEALERSDVRDEIFKDQIVLVGARPFVRAFQQRQDEFRNPFHYGSWNKEWFMPGVEVHATEMLNLVRNDWLRRLTPRQEALILLLSALLFGGGLVWLRPIPATVTALAGALIGLGLARAAFAQGVWFPWLIVVAMQIPTAWGGSVVFYSVEWILMRRRLQSTIREQAALIDKAHDAILVQDLSGKIQYVNPGAERLYGWNLPQLRKEGIALELFSPDATAADAARAAALKHGEWNGELRQQTATGRIVTVESRWTLIRGPSGEPKALLLINSDITERKQLEAQLLRTQRMNTIGTLAGGMAHDLNNALAPILMGVQLLRRKPLDEETMQLLGLMETSTHRGADMVRQVLLFARGRGAEFERLLLGPLVKDLEKMVRETFPKNISVECYLAGDLWLVKGNPTQLHQVLLNLCVNARDAMPKGGRLSFAADNVKLDAAEAAMIAEARPGEFVSLLVSDTGEGMTPEIRARIFEPFFTTKPEGSGTGIGLATVARIVNSHQGFMRVESEQGEGTTFEVFLPRAQQAETAGPAPSIPVELPRGNGELILVAEDERAIRDLIEEGLTAQGYRVVTAAQGEEALALFRQHAAEVRLFLTDNAMPTMDGPQAIAQVRKWAPELPIILTSGEAQTDQNGEGVEVLAKPFSLEELVRAVTGVIADKPKRTG